MFDQPYAYGAPHQPWPPALEEQQANEGATSLSPQSLAQWERQPAVDYPPVSATTYDQASWYYPTPTSSDCRPLYAAPPRPISWDPAFANSNLRLAQHEPFAGSLQHGYQLGINHRPYSLATALEPSPAGPSEAPRDAFLRPSTNPPSRQVSPAPPPHSATFDHLNGSSMFPGVTAAAHPPYHLDYSTAASSGAPPLPSSWAPHQLYSEGPIASSSTAEWSTQHIHAPVPLPLSSNSARSFSTTSSAHLDQDRGTWLREGAHDDTYGWSQGDSWQQQVHGQHAASRLEARPAAGYWDWTAPNPTPLACEGSGALSHMSRSGSRTGSLSHVGTPREGVEQDVRDLGVGSSSLSSSVTPGMWNQDPVTSSSWTTGQLPQPPQAIPPRSNHSTPLPLEHLTLSHLSRHASVGSASSFADVSKATTPPSLAPLPTLNSKGKGKAASSVSDGQSPPSTTTTSVAGDAPKQRKQRRKANEPPRDMAQRRYACELCVEEPRLFARPSALKIHLLTHTKEKPHTCPTCNRAFAIASNLKRHQKLHAANARKAAEGGTPGHLIPMRVGGPLQEYQTT